MKKINQSKFKDYMPVKFYLNNIREMIDVFEGADIKYELQTDRFIYDNFEQLKSEENKIKSIQITSSNPYVLLWFSNNSARVYISNDDIASIGLFQKFNSIVSRRRRRFYSFNIFLSLMIIAFAIIVFPLNKGVLKYISSTFFIIQLSYSFLFLYVYFEKRSLIYNTI